MTLVEACVLRDAVRGEFPQVEAGVGAASTGANIMPDSAHYVVVTCRGERVDLRTDRAWAFYVIGLLVRVGC